MACYQEAVVSLFVRAQGVSKDDVVKVFGTDTVFCRQRRAVLLSRRQRRKRT